jgi:hypothetical protein
MTATLLTESLFVCFLFLERYTGNHTLYAQMIVSDLAVTLNTHPDISAVFRCNGGEGSQPGDHRLSESQVVEHALKENWK